MSINNVRLGDPYLLQSEKASRKSSEATEEENLVFPSGADSSEFINYYDESSSDSQQYVDTNQLRAELDQTKENQGFLGNLWDGFKNLTGIGAGSNKAEDAIDDYEKGLISKEEMQKAIDGYKKGQDMVVDVVADMASGIVSIGAFALSVPTGGASIAVGLGISTLVGAGVKTALKAADAAVGGREYSAKNALYDTATGAVNGLFGPITNGIGNTVTKTIATKIIKEGTEEVVEQAAKQGFKQIAKNIILNQTDDIVGGTLFRRTVVQGTGMAVDGALGGATDNMVRAGLDGENVIDAGIDGMVGGLIMAPIIGGGFRAASKAGSALGNKVFNRAGSEILDSAASTLPTKANVEPDPSLITTSNSASRTFTDDVISTTDIDSFSKMPIDDYTTLMSDIDPISKTVACNDPTSATEAGNVDGIQIEHIAAELIQDDSANIINNIALALSYADYAGKINSSAARDFTDAIQKAINESEFEKITPERLKTAWELLNSESKLSKELKGLSDKFHTHITNEGEFIYTQNAAAEIAEALGIKGNFVKLDGKEVFVLQNGSTTAKLSARPKGTDSIFSKVRNKLLELKTKTPYNEATVKPLIGDAQGVRMVTASADEIDLTPVRAQLSDSDYDSFVKYLKNEKVELSAEQMKRFDSIQTNLLTNINTQRTAQFVQDFANAIEEGKIRITELHNYSSKDGIPYYNGAQVDTIKNAYKTWYEKCEKLAKANQGGYRTGTNKDGIEIIIDKDGNEFLPQLLVESISDNHKKAIKQNGYTAVQFNMVSKDGQLVEFQYRGDQIDEMAECEHIIYDIKKNKDTILGEDYKEAREALAKIMYDENIMAEFDQYYNDVFKTYRKLELGVPATMPKIEDYPQLSSVLSENELRTIDAAGIIELHRKIKAKEELAKNQK